MAKIQLLRASGTPVRIEDNEAYRQAYRDMFDKCAERAGSNMTKMQRFLKFCDRQLIKKYNPDVFIDMPQTHEELCELYDTYGPLQLMMLANKPECVYVIMDMQFGNANFDGV